MLVYECYLQNVFTIHIYIYIYIYIWVVNTFWIYIYIYIYMCVCVCVCVCKQDLALNDPQGLICHKVQPNQPNQSRSFPPPHTHTHKFSLSVPRLFFIFSSLSGHTLCRSSLCSSPHSLHINLGILVIFFINPKFLAFPKNLLSVHCLCYSPPPPPPPPLFILLPQLEQSSATNFFIMATQRIIKDVCIIFSYLIFHTQSKISILLISCK